MTDRQTNRQTNQPTDKLTGDTGFPKRDAHFSKLKNISDLLSDDEEGKIM